MVIFKRSCEVGCEKILVSVNRVFRLLKGFLLKGTRVFRPLEGFLGPTWALWEPK